MRTRIIPILLLKSSGLYKTRKFSDPKYIGDPINAIRIFNDKEVDELAFLDIEASKDKRGPDFDLLKDIASECFMPLSYGGGISSVEMVRELIAIGFEKVIINTSAYKNPSLVSELSERFGVSTVVGSIDVKTGWFGKEQVYISSGREKIPYSPIEWAQELERRGVGEIIINSIDNDGEMGGYNFDLIKRVAQAVSVPVIAAGGAASVQHFEEAIHECGATAVAAGAMFVFQGKHRAVLITYPQEDERGSL